MSFKIEENIVKVKKDCKTCTHVKVCKYHSKMDDLCKTNEFYGMTEYIEWNNSLEAFELNASCQYFKLNYDIPKDGSLTLEIDKNIIDEIVRLEKPKELSSWRIDIKDDNVVFNITNKEVVNVKISDLLLKYKFSLK